ncbi:lysosomal aspartic protease-like [Planococcus citri]|uniref:lysosomal aspartic protease-like n=1 Tax=Planococcus citri TaxID=170843 RepID=UPI0031F81757
MAAHILIMKLFCLLLLLIFINIRDIGGSGIRIPLSIYEPEGHEHDRIFHGTISIGTPPQKFNVLFTTQYSINIVLSINHCNRSADCDCQNHATYNHTTYNHKNSKTFQCEYDFDTKILEDYEGTLVTDTFTIDNIQIQNVSFYAAACNMLIKHQPYDGIVGLTYDGLLKHCKTLGLKNKFSLYTNYPWDNSTSELILCGEDKTKFRGNMHYTKTYPQNAGWMIRTQGLFLHRNGESVRTMEFLGERFLVQPDHPYITGPSEDMKKIHKALHTTTSQNGNLQQVDCKTVHTLPDITFRIDDKDFTLTGNDYIQQLTQNDQQVCVVRLISFDATTYWIMGNVFTRKFYTVIDAENERVGFAEGIHGNRPAQIMIFFS